LTTWYKRDEQSWVVSLFMAGTTLAGAFGGVLAFGIRHMAGIAGKDGWSWIFILEGIVTFVCAVPAWWLIPDFPEDGRVLRGIDQKRWLRRLREDQGVIGASIPLSAKQVRAVFSEWKTYVYAIMFMGVGNPSIRWPCSRRQLSRNLVTPTPTPICSPCLPMHLASSLL